MTMKPGNNSPDGNTAAEYDYAFRFRYETLRSLLNKNGGALQLLSDLEADLNHLRHYDRRIRRPIQRLITEALLMAQELNLMTGDRHTDLYGVIFGLRNQVDRLFAGNPPAADQPAVVGLRDPDGSDPDLIGGKAFGLRTLHTYFPDHVPPGFVATTAAYQRFIEANALQDRIRILLNDLDVTEDPDRFQSRTRTIRKLIREAKVPEDIAAAIMDRAKALEARFPGIRWAVRSSAVSEDGAHSFAGQFDSELQIETENLPTAFRHVLASRFTDRAVKYRFHHQFREVDTPMAVLFMPMIDPAAAGVAYTTDIKDPGAGILEISCVPGLANRMVKGEVPGDTFRVKKGTALEIAEMVPAAGRKSDAVDYVSREKILEIAGLCLKAADRLGSDLDVEWAVDKTGVVSFLQARPLRTAAPEDIPAKSSERKDTFPLLEGGITIFPGRAEGPLKTLKPGDDLNDVPDGAVVLVDQPRPELAAILPRIAALLIMEGNPVGHLATLVREFAVPCVFRLGENAVPLLSGKNIISVNATKRTVYAGIRWPGIRERVLARIAQGRRREKKSGPLYDLVLALNLLDPDASSFKAKACRSVHDTLRFMHEMSVRSMFGFGDKEDRRWRKRSRKLETSLPMKFQIIDLDHCVPEKFKKIPPESVGSVPFQALWRGVADARLVWPERWETAMRGMPADFKETVLGGNRGPRRPSDKNYAIVARDYMNLNARFAYHYAMIDAMVGPGTEHNHVHFRFRGGGAGEENKQRRARFLERVLRESGFGVDRSGDLVTAWFRRYPRPDSEKALELLGRLIVCARQLDAVLSTDAAVKRYGAYFLEQRYDMFG